MVRTLTQRNNPGYWCYIAMNYATEFWLDQRQRHRQFKEIKEIVNNILSMSNQASLPQKIGYHDVSPLSMTHNAPSILRNKKWRSSKKAYFIRIIS